MDTLLLARLQFATTTSIHFLFVVVTLGLVTLLVGLQTAWYVTGNPEYERMTRFWGQLYVINYVLGIATGIVMEFQFGLNWSGLSRYVGNVFGAPLAIETLVAFFLESTFLGMWIFGWHRLRQAASTSRCSGASRSPRTPRRSGSWWPTPGCRTRSATRCATGSPTSPTSARCSPTPRLGMAFGHVLGRALLIGGMLMAGGQRLAPDPAYPGLRAASAPRCGSAWSPRARRRSRWCRASASPSSARSARCSRPSSAATRPARAGLIAEWTTRFGPGDYTPPVLVQRRARLHDPDRLHPGLRLVAAAAALPGLDHPAALPALADPARPAAAVRRGDPRLARPGGRPAALGRVRAAPHRAGRLPGRRAGLMLASLIGFSLLLGTLAVTNWVLLARHAARGAADPALGRPPGAAPRRAARPEPALV